MNSRRICVFAHYDRQDIVDDYVLFYLAQLKKVADKIVFVTGSNLPESEKNKLNALCFSVIARNGPGYDFRSWRIGIESVDLQSFDELIIANDSCYGPLFPLEDSFDHMKAKQIDFWGVTKGKFNYVHIQPYFAVFRKSILSSSAFLEYWNLVDTTEDKWSVIRKFEVTLTDFFVKRGYTYDLLIGSSVRYYLFLFRYFLILFLVFCIGILIKPHKVFSKFHWERVKKGFSLKEFIHGIFNPNLTHHYWSGMIKDGAPFIKIELLRDNPTRQNLKNSIDFISKNTPYPVDLITRHLERMREAKNRK